jgi:VWFA-related protein
MRTPILAIVVAISIGPALAETRTFDARQGDTLLIQNDYGRVRIRGAAGSQIAVSVEPTLSGAPGAEHVKVTTEKAGNNIFVYSFFGNAPGETVDVEIDAPAFVNVNLWGANPEVEIAGMQGYVRVNTLTGQIGGENLTSSVSLISDRGSIVYRLHVQPSGDARLETTSGQIRCELGNLLNLRAWARAGAQTTWDRQPEGQNLEKQMGTGGPLLYAGSLQGGVAFETVDAPKVQPAGTGTRDAAISTTTPAREPERPRPRAPEPERPAPPPDPPESHGRADDSEPAPPSQPPAPPRTGNDGNPTFSVSVDWVFLNVSVRDRNTNRTISGLEMRDFQVYEDGVLQNLEHFQPTEMPFNLLLLLDISGSTEPYIDLIKEASIDFTRQINENDRIAVAVFNSRVELIQDFTSDRRIVASAIDGIRSGGGTAFYDALETCVDDYILGVEGRKAIVVFTDGVDNRLSGNRAQGSRTSFEELYRTIQEIDPIIYPIFLDTEGGVTPTTRSPGRGGGILGDILGDIIRGRTQRRVPTVGRGSTSQVYEEAREQLQLIADQTGGRMYAPRAIHDLRGVYSEVAGDLRIQYRLGYSSTNKAHDGRWREIQVQVGGYPNAAIRTRRGYYAGRQGATSRGD